jgi:hypothetical protein
MADEDPLLDELKKLVSSDVLALLEARDSAPKLIAKLPRGRERDPQRAWELVSLDLIRHRRFHEALTVLETWYDYLLPYQKDSGERLHKGTPLVWIRDCHVNQEHTALGKRFMMLTLVEDAIAGEGHVDPEKTGSYFRLVWCTGMADSQVRRYAQKISAFAKDNGTAAFYPERVLQELDKLWMTEFPTARESLLYPVNRRYVADLLSQTGEGTGKTLEVLAEYLLAVMPGCRTHRRKLSPSTDYDIVCSVDGMEQDFRSELGRYFVCECKDWKGPTDFSAFAKFARVLDSTKSQFGILFSQEGITGEGTTRNASREQLKLFQDRGIVIVVVSRKDIEAVINGVNFISLLREKYETVRLDLVAEQD